MADENASVMSIIVNIFDLIWFLLRLDYEIIKSIIKLFVPREPKDVTGEIVLITGAGHGIGRELALRFGRLGSKVVCVDINFKGNEETATMIRKEAKGKAYTYLCDVSSQAAVFQLAENVRKDVGDVSILINNAGIMPTKPLLDTSEKEVQAIMDINVNGNLWAIQAFLPAMIERNHGHIVALASLAGLMGTCNLVPYCASKFAVRGYMEALQAELNANPRDTSGIKLTTICPYMVDTGLCKKPHIKYPSLMQMEPAGDTADQIVDAVRRELWEITVPSFWYYALKFFVRLLPVSALNIINEFIETGVHPHYD